jgi:hypothetical protein
VRVTKPEIVRSLEALNTRLVNTVDDWLDTYLTEAEAKAYDKLLAPGGLRDLLTDEIDALTADVRDTLCRLTSAARKGNK